jgi:curved DNA-binding protein
VLRLRGQGWPKQDGARGDELAEVRLTVPEKLTDEQADLYKQLLELGGAS